MISFKDFKQRQEIKKLPLREQFFRGYIFTVGQIVEHTPTGKRFEIINRGTNYVVSVDESGNLGKWFIDNLALCEDATIPYHVSDAEFSFKGYKPSQIFQSNEQAVSSFRDTVKRYEDGLINDAVAIVKAIKSVDAFLNMMHEVVVENKVIPIENIQRELDSARNCLSKIGEFMHHEDYLHTIADTLVVHNAKNDNLDESMNQEKLTAAKLIAKTFGASTEGDDPVTIINTALKTLNKRRISKDAIGIAIKMLGLATKLGIKYDTNLVPSTGLKEAEELEELNVDTLKSYSNKAKASAVKLGNQGAKSKNIDTAYNKFKKATIRLANADKADKKVFKKEWNKRIGLSEEELLECYKPGTPVKVDANGNIRYGKVKGVHGSVVEVSHKNGKVGFYHGHKVQLNEVEPVDEEVRLTYDELLKIKKHGDTGLGPTEVPHGHTLNPSNDTHRKQLIHKLRGD